jgi:hypothetical protein
MKDQRLEEIDIVLMDNTLRDIVYVVSEILLAEDEPDAEFVMAFMKAIREEVFSKSVISKLLSERYKREELTNMFGQIGTTMN